ncbi:hypothetical protein CYQ78_13010, partial [Enterococcus faecium]
AEGDEDGDADEDKAHNCHNVHCLWAVDVLAGKAGADDGDNESGEGHPFLDGVTVSYAAPAFVDAGGVNVQVEAEGEEV